MAENGIPIAGKNASGDKEDITVVNGAALTTAVSAAGVAELTYVTYSGGGYTYWCEAAPGSARSSAVWHVARRTDADGTIIHAGTGAFDQVATDLAAVAALTYTLGA